MINVSIIYRFILFFSAVLLSVVLVAQKPAAQSGYRVDVLAPLEVQANTEMETEFIITKGDYTGSMQVMQSLPEGFTFGDHQPENATLDISGTNFMLEWKRLPEGERFRFRLKFNVLTQNVAVYPFSGRILIDGEWIGYSAPISANAGYDKVDMNEVPQEQPVKLFFEYPDVIRPDETFTFVTTFVKDQNYTPPGELLQVWPDAFTPVSTSMSNADFEIRGRLVMLSWDQMANEPEFSIAYRVKADTEIDGAYPVITEYNDAKGLQIQENRAVFLIADKKGPDVVRTETKRPTNIGLEFPDEIYKDDLLEFSCRISPAGLEGPVAVHLKLPPEAVLLSGSIKDFEFNRESAVAIFHPGDQSGSSTIEITGRVDVSQVDAAVYPVLVSLFHQGREVARKVDQLMVTDEPTKEKKQQEVTQEPAVTVDTTAMFSRLDALLDQWKKSTVADTQVSPERITDKQTPAPVRPEEPFKKQEAGKMDTGMNVINKIKTCYCIQIAASKSPLPELQSSIAELGIELPLHEDFDGEWHRYMLGQFKMLREAINYLEIVRQKGFPDAFIVNYLDGVRSKRIY